MHGQRDASKRGIVHGTVIFVGPGGVGKNTFDAALNFRIGLFLSYAGGETAGDFAGSLGKVLGDVVEDLGSIVSRSLGPRGFRFAGGFHCIANVLAVPEGRFAEDAAARIANLHAVARVWASLHATYVKLYRTIDRWGCDVSAFLGRLIRDRRGVFGCGCVLEPRRLEIFEEAFPAAFAAVAAFPV